MKVIGFRTAALVGVIFSWGAIALASAGGVGTTADQALQKLLEGNARYVENRMKDVGQCNLATRESLAKGQKPYAIILSCSDSRVPPEIVFDKTLGEIFVVRVAGNVVDPVVLGSIEYAAEHLGSPLIMVLGHERCGAVTAAVEAKGKPEGNIGAIVKSIAPAAQKAKQLCPDCASKDKPRLIEQAIDENAKLVAADLPRKSPVLRNLVKEGKVKVIVAKYDLDDGKVTVFAQPGKQVK